MCTFHGSNEEQPSLHLAPAVATRTGAANPNSGKRRCAMCQHLICQSIGQQVNRSKLVKSSQIFKSGQRRWVYFQILIFLDISTKLDYRIENGLFGKLIQILIGDNLS